MERKQDYTPEFRAEAVKVVLAQGLSLAEAAKRLSVPKGDLSELGSQCQRLEDAGCTGSTHGGRAGG